jgi:UDP-N-acetylglucosamine--N-acetylmuramyl-(pentapeptide) pyrophosphoryl-undecaprenol N-acetylglucosamine transferase
MGGSQGARALNQWAIEAAPQLAQRRVQTLVVTGPNQGEASQEELPGPAGESVPFVRLPFCDQMAALYSAGDLVVSRSGAGTLAELMRCRVPAVLVPYPHAADGHQEANAREFVRRGGGLLVGEDELERLNEEIPALMADESRLAEMRAQVGHLRREEALDLLYADVEVLAGLREPGDTFAPWGGAATE